MSAFYYKYAQNGCGFIKVVTHPENHNFMIEDGWKDNADGVKPPRRRRTKAEMLDVDNLERSLEKAVKGTAEKLKDDLEEKFIVTVTGEDDGNSSAGH